MYIQLDSNINKPGQMNPKNAPFVIETIKTAAKGCLDKNFDAMVTGPISKSILNKGGFRSIWSY